MVNEETRSEYVLEMIGIDKRFQGVHALKGCSLNLKRGEVLALVGENGAGKSTMMKILTGIHEYDEGEILHFGKKIKFKTPRAAQDAGISIVHQELNLMNHLTVAQNIFIGRESQGFFLDDKGINKKSAELFEKLGVLIDPQEKVMNLTVGKQQIVEIARAISFDANIIIFDEPTSTLTDAEIDLLFNIIGELKEKGVAMVYISHRLDEIQRITDRVTVLRDGELVGTKDTSDLTIDEIIHMMIGRVTFEEPKQSSSVPDDAPVVLKAENLCSKDVNNVSFKLHRGEILGFAGLMGAGRTEVARLIFGADKRWSGDIFINDFKVDIRSPRDAVKHGIGYLSEDRKRFGLAVGMKISDNMVLATLDDYTTSGIVNDAKIKAVANEYVEKIDVRTPSIEQFVKNLSGGNQQKVVIAKWLIRNCDILIFDEPTRGIDVGAKSEIYKLMNSLAESGKSIIMISSELPELLRMSDRVFVMCEGAHTGTLSIDKANQHSIMALAAQGSSLTRSATATAEE
ncbi:MAG: sugar ABC transporter ATP-binding protein [Oscillospiraceae bacterium]|nr:sugar ABC transporter ATP-binding protein [Oscillospiraceae bacterium]